jgi:hypothetical protein
MSLAIPELRAMVDTTLRLRLEAEIIEKNHQVPMHFETADWVSSSQMETLLDTWYELVRYYESNNDDSVISVEVLSAYLQPTRHLRKLQVHQNYRTDLEKEQIEEALRTLEQWLENIIREAVTGLNN